MLHGAVHSLGSQLGTQVNLRAIALLPPPPAGKVALVGAGAAVVNPEWFRRPGEADADSNALQRAVGACLAKCTLMLSRYQAVTKASPSRRRGASGAAGGGALSLQP